MADDEEEEDDEIDRDRNVHRSLGRVGSTSGLGVDQDGALPALWSSLFNYIPPTLYFHLEDEKGQRDRTFLSVIPNHISWRVFYAKVKIPV